MVSFLILALFFASSFFFTNSSSSSALIFLSMTVRNASANRRIILRDSFDVVYWCPDIHCA